MFERGRVTLVLVAALAAAGAGADAAAQPVDVGTQEVDVGTPEALRARLDSLRPLVQEAREAMVERAARLNEARRVAAAAEARVDTSTFGGATLLTPVDQVDRARALFSSVWEEHYAHLGASLALARSTFVLQWTEDPVRVHVDGEASRLVLDRWTRDTRAEEAVRAMIGAAMSHDVRVNATEVGRWLRGNPFIPVSMEHVYRRVATTPSRATRACLAGDADACGSAMGLGIEPGAAMTAEQLDSWYTPAERRALAASSIEEGNRRWEMARRACVDDGVACDALIMEYTYRDWAPLGATERISLVAFALEMGREGAWARLVEHPAMTPSEALAHASGMPTDALLEGWRERLLEHRPDTFEDLAPNTGRTLVWTLFFAALALRSTRWRLG